MTGVKECRRIGCYKNDDGLCTAEDIIIGVKGRCISMKGRKPTRNGSSGLGRIERRKYNKEKWGEL